MAASTSSPIKKLLSAFAAAAVSAARPVRRKDERERKAVDKTQVNRLIEVLMQSDPDTLLIHIARQRARGEIDPITARHLVAAISMVLSGGSGEQVKRELLRYLGYFKWFYESLDKVDSSSLNKLFSSIRNINDIKNIPEDFYLKVILTAIGAK